MKFVRDFELQRCEDLLHALVEDFDQAVDDPRRRNWVAVTVGPHTFEGIPAKIDTLGGEPWLGLLRPDGGVDGSEALTVLPLRAVTTVTLKTVRAYVGRTRYGGAGALDEAAVPARLAIERALVDAAAPARDTLGDAAPAFAIDWSGNDADAPTRHLVHELVRSLEPVVASLCKEPIGLDALRALRLVAVVVRGDGGLAVGRRDDDALEIAIGSATTVRQIRTQLRTMIERHL